MTDTPQELLRRVHAATEELDQARERMRKEKTSGAAMAYCRAFYARRAAQSALPKLRAIES